MLLATCRIVLLCTTGLAFTPAMLSQTDVTAVLPNGRTIHPAGNWIPLAPYPFALAVRQDGNEISVPSIGFPFALNVIENPGGMHPMVRQMPAGHEKDPAIEVHAGLAYAPAGSLLYVATGDSGKIRAYRTSDWKATGEVSLDGAVAGIERSGSFAATLTVSSDGKTLYVLDQGNSRIVILDAAKLERIAEIPTGSYPFGLALSPDGTRLYVTNTGLFEYSPIPGVNPKDLLGTGLHFAPFGYPSKAAREGTVAEGKQIHGLGDENSDRGSSLWTYDVRDRERPALRARLRLGTRISELRGQTVGGSAPTGVATTENAAFVSLAHEDEVVKVSADGSRLLAEAALSPFSGRRFEDNEGRPLRGVMPSGLTVRNGRVYVAESGIDAVAVLDADSLKAVEQIPVGWNPSAVELSPDGKTLFVVNTKGKGAGPNAGEKHDPATPTYVGSLEMGSLSAISLDTLPSAETLTQTAPPLPTVRRFRASNTAFWSYERTEPTTRSSATWLAPMVILRWLAMDWMAGPRSGNPPSISGSRPTYTLWWDSSP
jgi:YVTN family beta-propeller protein